MTTKKLLIKNGKNDLKEFKKNQLEKIAKKLCSNLWKHHKKSKRKNPFWDIEYEIEKILMLKYYDEQSTPENTPYQFQLFREDKTHPVNFYKRINRLYKGEKYTENSNGPVYIDCMLKSLKKYSDKTIDLVNNLTFNVLILRYVIKTLQNIYLSKDYYDITRIFLKEAIRLKFKS